MARNFLDHEAQAPRLSEIEVDRINPPPNKGTPVPLIGPTFRIKNVFHYLGSTSTERVV